MGHKKVAYCIGKKGDVYRLLTSDGRDIFVNEMDLQSWINYKGLEVKNLDMDWLGNIKRKKEVQIPEDWIQKFKERKKG